MSAKSLFNVIVKVLGIYFLKDLIIALPTLISTVYIVGRGDFTAALSTFLLSAFTFLVYGFIIYYLVFKTERVIERLKILENIPEDPIPLNIHRSTVIAISIMVVGLFLITQSIPLLIRGLAKWYSYSQQSKGLFNMAEPFDFSLILVYAAEIVVGLLLIGYQKNLVNYIELRQRKNGV